MGHFNVLPLQRGKNELLVLESLHTRVKIDAKVKSEIIYEKSVLTI